MAVEFRNVDASPEDDVRTWPYEALVAVIDRGLVSDWKPVFAEIHRSPWGSVARRVERYLSYREPDGAGTLFALAIERARRRGRGSPPPTGRPSPSPAPAPDRAAAHAAPRRPRRP